ncbi:hypothetical protein MPSEU_000559100 [Mayamaea pseudoterrestris]|nr:hypothetical protein MPSEU_000559100 [Mayamaea pseudoterrestris]
MNVNSLSIHDEDEATPVLLSEPTVGLLHLYLNRSLSCPGVTSYIFDFLSDEIARIRLEEIKESYQSSGTTISITSGGSSHLTFDSGNETYHERAGPVLKELASMMQTPFANNVLLLRQAFAVVFRVLQSVPDLMIGFYQTDKQWQRNETQASNWRIVFVKHHLPVVLTILKEHGDLLRSECCSVLYRCFMYVSRADAREWNQTFMQALIRARGDKAIIGERDCDLNDWTEPGLKDTHCLVQKMIHVLKANVANGAVPTRKVERLERTNQRIVEHLRERRQNILVPVGGTV